MRYRQLGNTGIQVSEIGFGAGDNAGLMVDAYFDEQCRVLGRAFELGINYIDTAAGYGDSKSETNLGRVLKELRVRPILNSKMEIVPSQLNDIAGTVVASVECSLQRLGVDALDIVQIHNPLVYHRPENAAYGPTGPWLPLEPDEYFGPGGVMEGLSRLRKSGMARFTGFAGQGSVPILGKAVFATGEISLLNVPYNLINPTAGMPAPDGLKVDVDNLRVIDYAAQHGSGVAVISPLASGVLTDKSVAEGYRHPLAGTAMLRNKEAWQRRMRQAASLSFLARDGRTLGQAAVQFILLNPNVSLALGGFTAVEQVEEMVGALSAPPLSDEDLARINIAWRSNLGVD
jgi:aryl-alcohol dehydrogenase-like predicted oxidoreductase